MTNQTKPNPPTPSHDSVVAWHSLRTKSKYKKAWDKQSKCAAHSLQEQTSLPYRQYKQTEDDLTASEWGLYCWVDPDSDGESGFPLFWSIMPTLEVTLIPETEAPPGGASLSELFAGFSRNDGDNAALTLLDGDLILRISEPGLVIQLRIKNGGTGIDPEMKIFIANFPIGASTENSLDIFEIILDRLRPVRD